MLCPYCQKRKLIRVTCGNAICKDIHHKQAMVIYWHKVYRFYSVKGAREKKN
jgi:hypothetical protein